MQTAVRHHETSRVGTCGSVSSSRGLGMVLMLYDGAIEYLRKASEFTSSGDIKKRNIYINKANDIVVELDGAIDMEAGELSINLRKFYAFVNNHLVRATQNRGTREIDDAIRLLRNLRKGWQEISN